MISFSSSSPCHIAHILCHERVLSPENIPFTPWALRAFPAPWEEAGGAGDGAGGADAIVLRVVAQEEEEVGWWRERWQRRQRTRESGELGWGGGGRGCKAVTRCRQCRHCRCRHCRCCDAGGRAWLGQCARKCVAGTLIALVKHVK
jgi:hypothetical protein